MSLARNNFSLPHNTTFFRTNSEDYNVTMKENFYDLGLFVIGNEIQQPFHLYENDLPFAIVYTNSSKKTRIHFSGHFGLGTIDVDSKIVHSETYKTTLNHMFSKTNAESLREYRNFRETTVGTNEFGVKVYGAACLNANRRPNAEDLKLLQQQQERIQQEIIRAQAIIIQRDALQARCEEAKNKLVHR